MESLRIASQDSCTRETATKPETPRREKIRTQAPKETVTVHSLGTGSIRKESQPATIRAEMVDGVDLCAREGLGS